MQRILIASSNPKKLAELRALCAELPVELLGPDALAGALPEVDEDGETFLDNAAKKALAFAEVAAAIHISSRTRFNSADTTRILTCQKVACPRDELREHRRQRR